MYQTEGKAEKLVFVGVCVITELLCGPRYGQAHSPTEIPKTWLLDTPVPLEFLFMSIPIIYSVHKSMPQQLFVGFFHLRTNCRNASSST